MLIKSFLFAGLTLWEIYWNVPEQSWAGEEEASIRKGGRIWGDSIRGEGMIFWTARLAALSTCPGVNGGRGWPSQTSRWAMSPRSGTPINVTQDTGRLARSYLAMWCRHQIICWKAMLHWLCSLISPFDSPLYFPLWFPFDSPLYFPGSLQVTQSSPNTPLMARKLKSKSRHQSFSPIRWQFCFYPAKVWFLLC